MRMLRYPNKKPFLNPAQGERPPQRGAAGCFPGTRWRSPPHTTIGSADGPPLSRYAGEGHRSAFGWFLGRGTRRRVATVTTLQRGLVGLALLLLLAVAHAAAEPFGHGLLWKIERPGVRPSYLYGTMHAEDTRVATLPAPVRDAFARSASLALEVTLDEATLQAMAAAMFFQDGRDLRQVAGAELFDAAARAMAQHGMPAEAVARMKPWAVMTILSTPPQKTGMFLDRLLYEEAGRAGKPVYGLETGAEQMALFDDTPLPDQVHLLRETLADYARMPEFFEQMIALYQARDAGGLLALSRRELPSDDPIAQRFMRRLLEDRNRRLAARMEPRLRQGHAFIAIGALHLPGADGVLRLLQRRGYRISVVY